MKRARIMGNNPSVSSTSFLPNKKMYSAKVAPAPYVKPEPTSGIVVASSVLISHPQKCTDCTKTHGDPGLLTFPCGHSYDLHCAKTYAWMNDLAYCVHCRIRNPANLERVLDLIYKCAHMDPGTDSADSIACHRYDAVVTGRTREGKPMEYYNFDFDRWVAPMPLRSVWS